jgi:prepilin-type N-terminal cleavage/methylation domain-containing protein
MPFQRDSRASFTLIELLIVIAVVAILSVVVVLVLNPAELLKQARDSNRIADLEALNKALTLYLGDRGGSLGTASTTYFSLIDLTATTTAGTNCAGVGITAPSGWNYHCAASSTARKLDGTGWIPLNFSAITFSPPFGALPLDPTNTSSSGLFYMYVPGTATYALAAALNSSKYLASKGNGDGGYDPSRLEVGSGLVQVARGEGLVGWWTLDETSGSSAADSSGSGNTGTVGGSVIAGKIANARSFSTTTSMLISNAGSAAMTIMAWHKRDDTVSEPTWRDIFAGDGPNNKHFLIFNSANKHMGIYNSGFYDGVYTEPNDGAWHHYAVVYKSSSSQDFYADGVFQATVNSGLDPSAYQLVYVGGWAANYAVGPLDEARIYSRALSAAEVLAIYNAQR